jgi:hypothetical protein
VGDRRAAVLLGALVLAGLIVFSGQRPLDTHHDQWRGPHVSSDGWYYYHELRSLAEEAV